MSDNLTLLEFHVLALYFLFTLNDAILILNDSRNSNSLNIVFTC